MNRSAWMVQGLLLLSAAASAASDGTLDALQMKGEVLAVTYCRADEEVGFVNVRLKLLLTNSGVESITLNNVGPIEYVLVSRTAEDLLSRRYDHEYSWTTIEAVRTNKVIKKPDIYLPPQQTYALEREVNLPTWLSPAPGGSYGVKPGNHAFSVVLTVSCNNLLSGSQREPAASQRPVARSMRSGPILITVEDVTPDRRCGSNR